MQTSGRYGIICACRRGVGSMVNRRPPNPVFRVRIPAPLPQLTQMFSCSIIQAYPLSWSACMIHKPNCACKICGTMVYRRPRDLERNNGNVYCTHTCYAKSCQRPVPCVICGKEILGIRHSKTCSRACANKNRAGIKYKTGVYKKDKVKWAQGLKTRLIEQRGTVGGRCGYTNTQILVVHHIVRRSDGGSDDLDNLELICPNCHAEVHFYGVKHSKKGATTKHNGSVTEPG